MSKVDDCKGVGEEVTPTPPALYKWESHKTRLPWCARRYGSYEADAEIGTERNVLEASVSIRMNIFGDKRAKACMPMGN